MIYTTGLPSRKLAVIEEVWTDPDYRREGRARRLVNDAINLAKSWGSTCIELTVREDAPEVQAFYQSMGFEDRLNRAYRLKL